MLNATGLAVAYDDRFIFKDLSLSVASSEVVAIRGVNGIGKSTLLQVLASIRRPLFGAVSFEDRAIYPGKPADVSWFRSRLGYVGHSFFLYRDLTIEENLRYLKAGKGDANSAKRTEELLTGFGLALHLNKKISACSLGTARKTSIVAALIAAPELLILDEPFSGLDQESSDYLIEILKAHKQQGGLAIISTHADPALNSVISKELVIG